MMRSGRLLVEESPENLLGHHRLSSLEDVFLKLCMKDDATVAADQFTSTTANALPLNDMDHVNARTEQTLFPQRTAQLDVTQTGDDMLLTTV